MDNEQRTDNSEQLNGSETHETADAPDVAETSAIADVNDVEQESDVEDTATVEVVPRKSNIVVTLALKLFAITAVVSLLLSVVNALTEDAIYEARNATRLAAISEVLPERDGYSAGRDTIEYNGATLTPVTNLFSSFLSLDVAHAYCAEVSVQGYAGMIDLMVGVRLTPNFDGSGSGEAVWYDFEVTKVVIVSQSETMGVSRHGDFVAQFAGRAPSITVGGGDNAVDAISGATVSSRAITAGVNAAVEAVRGYVAEQTGGRVDG